MGVRASKLRPIVGRVGVVRRSALLDSIAHSGAPVVTVVAPAGYGKTTMLTQWSEHTQSEVAWLSIDDADNDPVVFAAGVAASLDSVAPVGDELYAALASHRGPAALGALLVDAIETMTVPITLIIDQLECVTNAECVDIIGQVAVGLPEGARLVLSSRVQPRLPTARLRVQGQLLEIGTRHLALTAAEAKGMLVAAGADPANHDIDMLIDRTEGWPAGLYLAAVATTNGNPESDPKSLLRGDNRHVSDYLHAEVLDRLSPEDASFLKRASILEGMCGPLCDATLDVTGSAARLEALEARSVLVVPLDDRREWYRCHRLFGEMLRSELHRHEPDLEVQLHARAAAWYQESGRPEHALRHAQIAKDYDRVAQLVWDLQNPLWSSGRAETVRRWYEWMADEDMLGRYPALTAHGAIWFALLGYPAEAERWSNAAEQSDVSADAPDGSTMESVLAYLRAFLCRDGVAAMRADSIIAYEGFPATSIYRASMVFTEGFSYLIEGDSERAEPLLARAADAAIAIGAFPFAAIVFSVWGQLAASRDDWTAATELGDRALDLVGDGSFDEYWSSAPVFAFSARVAIQSRRTDAAQTLLARAARLRPLLTYALPVTSVSTLLDMARSYLALTDRAGATAVLHQARTILQQRPDLGQLGAQVDELTARVESTATILAGGTSLTAAELRLAPFLATHLTLQEIAGRMYVSRSTVKTQAVSIYHKLDAASRSHAVDRLRELGLVGLVGWSECDRSRDQETSPPLLGVQRPAADLVEQVAIQRRTSETSRFDAAGTMPASSSTDGSAALSARGRCPR